jgi:hypothetical protein
VGGEREEWAIGCCASTGESARERMTRRRRRIALGADIALKPREAKGEEFTTPQRSIWRFASSRV